MSYVKVQEGNVRPTKGANNAILSIFGRRCNWYDRDGLLGLPDDADFHILIEYRYTY